MAVRLWIAGIIGLIVSATALAQAKGPGAARPPGSAAASVYYGDSWALLIGIDEYKDPRIPRLKYAVNDVRAMQSALTTLGFKTMTLTNAQATKSAIEAAFQHLASLGEKDRLVVFFSGHGESQRLAKGSEEGFLVPYDADRTRLVQTGIPMRDIDRLGERLPPKHILFLLDACHSGFAFVGFRDIEPEVKGDAYYLAATQKPVVQVLTAGETGQKAVERDGQGIFTRWLVYGLQGAADRDGDGVITANELGAWIEPHVTRDSRGLQKPVSGRLFGEGQFLFELPRGTAGDPSRQLEEARRRLEDERRQLEEEKRVSEEQKRIEEQRDRLAAERRRLEEARQQRQAALVNLEGTVWKGSDHLGEWEITFEARGRLHYRRGDTSATGRWRLDGSSIFFDINNFSEREGRIIGTTMDLTVKNKDGRSWRETLTKER